MKTITPLGAAGTVTGSSYLITQEDQSTILIDLGMFQETATTEKLNYAPLPFDTQKLVGVFLTHAHLDHCGRLPLLVKQGYKGKIYTTEATKMLVHISLLDSVKIATEDKKNSVMYTEDDVEKTMSMIEIVIYDQPVSINNLTVYFRNAGHILGSASLEITDNTEPKKTIVFSGDLGNTPQDLIQATELISHADVVVMEATYGNGAHEQQDATAVLLDEVTAIEKTGGVLLIPAFSIERTQEVLHRIGHLKKDKKINADLPVFLDSPMAIKVTEIFKEYPKLYNNELASDTDPFNFSGLLVTKSVEESKSILKVSGPKIIIASSGMMSGGRILHHLLNYISLATTRLLLVGYQAVGTLGRDILNGEKTIMLYNQEVPVNATITDLKSLSSHADQPKLLNWLRNIQGVTKVFLTHAEDEQRRALQEEIKNVIGIQDVILPQKDEIYQL